MTEEHKPQNQSWWQTLPGILTATAAILTAFTGLIAGLYEIGVFPGTSEQQSSNGASTPSPAIAESPTSQPEKPAAYASQFPEGVIAPSQTSTDIDRPIPLTANGIEGLGIAEEVSHYYTFHGGPGYIEMTVRARNRGGVAASALGVEILKTNGTSLAKINLGYTDQFKTETLQFPLGQREKLLMRVDLDTATLEYRIEMTGAVHFN